MFSSDQTQFYAAIYIGNIYQTRENWLINQSKRDTWRATYSITCASVSSAPAAFTTYAIGICPASSSSTLFKF